MTIDRQSVLQRNPRVEFRLLAEGEGAVLLHLQTGAYHGVNEVGALVWEMLPGASVATLLDQLRQRLEDVPPTFESEICDYLQHLVDRDLVLVDAPREEEGDVGGSEISRHP